MSQLNPFFVSEIWWNLHLYVFMEISSRILIKQIGFQVWIWKLVVWIWTSTSVYITNQNNNNIATLQTNYPTFQYQVDLNQLKHRRVVYLSLSVCLLFVFFFKTFTWKKRHTKHPTVYLCCQNLNINILGV